MKIKKILIIYNYLLIKTMTVSNQLRKIQVMLKNMVLSAAYTNKFYPFTVINLLL